MFSHQTKVSRDNVCTCVSLCLSYSFFLSLSACMHDQTVYPTSHASRPRPGYTQKEEIGRVRLGGDFNPHRGTSRSLLCESLAPAGIHLGTDRRLLCQ